MKFHYPLVIKEHHLDTFGHVNNATYLEILEEARWEIITARGFGLKTIQKTGLGPVILEFNLKFLKELRLRQNIVIETELESYSGKVSILKQNILNDQGQVCFEGRMTYGLFDTRERKLVDPTPEWLHAMGAETPIR